MIYIGNFPDENVSFFRHFEGKTLIFVFSIKNSLDKIHCDTKAKYDLIMSLSLHFQQFLITFFVCC